MINKEFFESYPLYVKCTVELPKFLKAFDFQGLNLYCKKCKSTQTFGFFSFSSDMGDESPINGAIIELAYSCAGCDNSWQFYWVKIGDNLDYIMKIGQFPPLDISVDKNFKKILGKHEGTYKKGLICESQGYGIAAYVYYRRIVETIINELLEGIMDLVSDENKEEYKEALEQVQKSHSAQDKIDIVKDLLPPVLMPEGNNPLKLLYSQLSSGIHSLSDEECLKRASNIRNILIFLVKETINHQNSSKDFTESIKNLLSKK